MKLAKFYSFLTLILIPDFSKLLLYRYLHNKLWCTTYYILQYLKKEMQQITFSVTAQLGYGSGSGSPLREIAGSGSALRPKRIWNTAHRRSYSIPSSMDCNPCHLQALWWTVGLGLGSSCPSCLGRQEFRQFTKHTIKVSIRLPDTQFSQIFDIWFLWSLVQWAGLFKKYMPWNLLWYYVIFLSEKSRVLPS